MKIDFKTLLTLSAVAIVLTSAKSNVSLKFDEIVDKLSEEKLLDLQEKTSFTFWYLISF